MRLLAENSGQLVNYSQAGDFAGLRALAEAREDRFAFGTVLYDNTDVVPFGDRLAAAPLSNLWG